MEHDLRAGATGRRLALCLMLWLAAGLMLAGCGLKGSPEPPDGALEPYPFD